MALLLGKHFYFLSFLQFTFMCAKKRINKMHSSQHLFYRNKSTLFFARFYQQKPVSKLIYLVVMGWVQCSSQQMLQKYLCKKILFLQNLTENYGRLGKCFWIITSHIKEDNCGKSGGRHALLFIPYFLVVANFGSHSHFHEAKALNWCAIVKKVSPFRKTSHVFNAENIYQFLHPNTNCLSCMLLGTSTIFIPIGNFRSLYQFIISQKLHIPNSLALYTCTWWNHQVLRW